MRKITITNFTDPVCVWCWATEPVFRYLETHYPGDIEFRSICGGLVENIADFAAAGSGIPGGAEGANAQIAAHWTESANRHRMPILAEGFHLFNEEYPSTYPQSIAYKAMQMVAPHMAESYMRRLRKATLAEGLVTSRRDVQMDLAREMEVNMGLFEKALDNGTAEERFHGDLALTRGLGVSSFPTFLVKMDEGKQLMVRGFQDVESFRDILSYMTDGEMMPIEVPPDEELLGNLLLTHRFLSGEEVFCAFDFSSREDVDRWVEDLVAGGKIKKTPVGSSYFVEARPEK